MRLYLAGPMRGYDYYNFPAFIETADYLRKCGFEVVSPAEHDLDGGFDVLESLEDQGFHLAENLLWDLRQIAECDGIVLLPGWEQSSGAQAEHALALALKKKIYHLYLGYPYLGYPRMIEQSDKTAEQVIVDPLTGAKKGSKLARFDLVPPEVIWELAEHYGRGARKYDDRNWQAGYDWGLSYAAAQRHLHQFWSGEDTDEETGSSHLIAAAWHCIAMRYFQLKGKGTDSRG